MKLKSREPSGNVLPIYISDRMYISFEELLPCEEFECIHDSLVCGQALICPIGTKINGKYSGICIPQCVDCNKASTCNHQKQIKQIIKREDFNPSKREFGHENEIGRPTTELIECPECFGEQTDMEDSSKVCWKCHGTGKISHESIKTTFIKEYLKVIGHCDKI